MKKSKIYMIVCICLLFLSVIGSSVAYYREVLFNKDVSTITYGLDYYINYAKGQDISGVSLLPGTSYTDGNSSDIEFWKKDNTYDIYGHIYLDINEIGTNLSNTNGLKYTLVNNNQIISQGSLYGSRVGDSILVSANIPLQTTKQLYTIYIWLDANDDPDMSIEAEVLSVTVRCEATMKPINAKVNLLNHINSLYIANYDSSYDVSFADGTGMNYYAPNVKLMSDGLDSTGAMTNDPYRGNIRYYGADDSNLKNYIYFNCSDYSNQSEDTCETWRIIGIVDGKVKLIRSDSIGSYAWDYTSTGEYDNNWSDATLNTLLNTTYYNSGSGTYYDYENTDGITVDFSSNGITAATRNAKLISSSTWYTNGMTNYPIYANASYEGERTGTSTYPSNIGLAYPSDYGYGADLNTCTNTINNYGAYTCAAVNWLTGIFTTNNWYWLITPDSGYSGTVWSIIDDCVDYYYVDAVYSVVPVLYLEPELMINKGDGSSGNPYQLYVEEKTTLIEHITNLYTENYDSTKNVAFADDTGMNYYAPDARLMNDGLDSTGAMVSTDTAVNGTAGNIRYYGADDSNLKNYIYFNCSDYSNQSSSTCETWRIIGIVDGKVKLIKDESIGNYSWDFKSDGTYDNNWSDATLNTLLNNAYYKSASMTYYNDGVVTVASFVGDGITAATRDNNLISESTWYTNGMSDSDIYANASYEGERTGTSTYPSNIGLAYPSDYGYGADLNTCTNTIYNYEAEECTGVNWLTTMFTTGGSHWLIIPNSDFSDSVWNVGSGYVGYDDATVSATGGVVPVLYLEPSLAVQEVGDGSAGNPYRLDV